jgi:hypothetical protein
MKKQSLRSSRSYMERQKLAKLHQARTPQIYKKDLHADKTILTAIANFFMKFMHRKQSR